MMTTAASRALPSSTAISSADSSADSPHIRSSYLRALRALPPIPRLLHVTFVSERVLHSSSTLARQGVQRLAALNPEWTLQVYDDGTATQLTTMALGVGFRNFFSSVLAGNQQGFGAAIKATSVPRSEIFICGSVNTGSGACSGTADCKTQTAAGCQTNLQDIGVDYLDMSEFVSSVRPRSHRVADIRIVAATGWHRVARALAAAPCLPTCSPFYRVTGTCSSAPFLAPLHSHAGLPRR